MSHNQRKDNQIIVKCLHFTKPIIMVSISFAAFKIFAFQTSNNQPLFGMEMYFTTLYLYHKRRQALFSESLHHKSSSRQKAFTTAYILLIDWQGSVSKLKPLPKVVGEVFSFYARYNNSMFASLHSLIMASGHSAGCTSPMCAFCMSSMHRRD